MRTLRLWIDEPSLGSGFYQLLEVEVGRKSTRLLHVPSLTRVELDNQEIERQLRSGTATEVKRERGTIGRLKSQMTAWNGYGFRYPAVFCKKALEQLQAERSNPVA